MKDRIKNAFDDIRADDTLLAKMEARLREERAKRAKQPSPIRLMRFVGALAALLVLVAGIFEYRFFYSGAAAYVSIDVNPSLELTLNRMDKVIAATAYNGEGEALLQQVNVTRKPYDEAVTMLLAEMELQGYISDDALVTMTVQTADGARERALCDALLKTASDQMGIGQSAAGVEVFPVTQEVRETAHGCHMSAAKYLAIQELMEVDKTATQEEYSDSTIQQIRQRTRECRGEHEGGSSSSGNQGSEQGYGNGPNQGGGHHGRDTGQSDGQGHGHRGRND